MSNLLIILGLALGVALFASYIIFRRKAVTKARLDKIKDSSLTQGTTSKEKKTKQFFTIDSFKKTKLASNDSLKKLVTTMESELSAAGLGDDPLRLLAIWVIIVIIVPMIMNLYGVNLIIVFTFIALFALGPVLFIQMSKNKRKTKFEKQLPHALDIIGNALKAGYTFPAAMNSAAEQLEEPVSTEFIMTYRETQFGVPLSDALQHMAKRTSSADIELLNVAVSVQSTVGGNMIEILDNISATLTAKHDLEEDIKVKTASGKITGLMLGALPVVMLIAMSVMNPEYPDMFFHEKLGNYMLIFCGVWEFIGFLVIRKILNVKY